MKQYYYGAWQNFYELAWPIRCFIELTLLLAIILLMIWIFSKMLLKSKVKTYIIKFLIWISSECLYCLGKEQEWSINLEEKLIDWGRKVINNNKKRNFGLQWCIGILVTLVYFSAIFVDLPFSKNFNSLYLQKFRNIKTFFINFESNLSEGYEEYPPLFVQKEEQELARLENDMMEEQEIIYLQLNARGQNGSNIRGIPSLDGPVIGGIRGETDILYQGQWEYDGERYWLKVYIPEEDVQGWISGKLINTNQLQGIISDK